MRNGDKRRAGAILRKVARDYLVEYCNHKDDIIECGDLDTIEEATGAISILDAVIRKLCSILEFRDGIVPPRRLFETIIYSENPEEEIEGFLCQVRQSSAPRRAELTIMMLNEAHDEWVQQHTALFFDPDKQYLQCRFMPMELIGFDAVKQYLIYIKDLLVLFGWTVDEKLLMMAYRLTQDKFYLKNELRSDEELVLFVAKAEYEALSPRIRRELMGNYDLARKMVYS